MTENAPVIAGFTGGVGLGQENTRLWYLRQILCLGVVAIGSVTLAGWITHVQALETILPGLTTMKVNTALGLISAGVGLLLIPASAERLFRPRIAIGFGLFVSCLGALTLLEYSTGWHGGIDELLFADPDTTSMPFPGRMSPATAVAFLAVGAGVILLARPKGRSPVIAAHVLSAVPAGIGYLSLAGYSYGVEGLYSFGPFVSVAIHTALAFAFLALALLMTRAQAGWANNYLQHPLARAVLMRLLALSLTVPFISGLFVVLGAKLNFYKPLFGPALFAAVSALATVWLALRASATVRTAEAAMLRANAALEDVNANLEREVAERTREQGLTWQISPDLLGVLNREGYLESSNPAWQTVLGWSAEELRATPLLDFSSPDDIQRSREAFEVVKRGEPILRFENRCRAKAGGYRWLSWIVVPEGGRFYCSARHVTEEKEQAILLAERTADRDRLWMTSEDLLAYADFAGGILRISPSWTSILGYSEESLQSIHYMDLVHPDDLSSVAASLDEIKRTRCPLRVDNRVRHADGSWRTIAWALSPEPTSDQFHAVGRDVTSEKEAEAIRIALEEQLRQAQKMEAVGQLTGGVAHDFNNLLTVIRSSTDLLKRPNLREDRRARYIDAISDTVDRAAKLTGQLLAFARRQALTPSVFDAGQSVQAISDMMSTLTGSRIKIVTQLADEDCFLNADPSQFDTALVNMAVNARDAMSGEGQLTICVRPVHELPATRTHKAVAGAFVAVSITDTGAGIPPDRQDRIFEPFFTTKGVGHGTGLGLSQVFGFAKQSGGEIRLESEVGRGTTFTLYLPRAAEQGARVTDLEPEPLMDGHGTRVLIVEDNIAVGTFANQTLAELGYHTVWTPNAEGALAELAKNVGHFDVVFSDVVMPGMNGIDLAQEIRRRYGGLPVVLTSGYSHVLAKSGTCGFELLRKPYSIEQLSRVLRKAAVQRPRRMLAG